jgi:hypothetical protein
MKLIINESQYDRLFNKPKTKLVVNESQYNRLINKQKTKLVINEAQYERLLFEARIVDSFNKIKENDAIKIILSKGDELFFKVIGVSDNALMIVNCNKGSVYTNTYFRINSNDIQGGNITYLAKHQNYFYIEALEKQTNGKYKTFNDVKKAKKAGDIDDKQFEELSKLLDSEVLNMGTGIVFQDLQKNKDTWKKGTFNNVKLQVYEDGSEGLTCKLSPGDEKDKKFDIDTGGGDTGAEGEGEKEGDKGDEGATAEEILRELNTIKEGEEWEFILQDDSVLNLNCLGTGANTVSFELEDDSGAEGSRYKELEGNTLEFKYDPKSINLKKDTGEEEGEGGILFDLKLTRFLGGEGEEGKTKSEEIIIHDIVDFQKAGIMSKSNNDVEGLSDEELNKIIDDLSKNNEILLKAIRKKPNWILDLFRISKDRGIVPAEKRLGTRVKDEASNVLQKRFPGGKVGVVEFTYLDVDDNKMKLALDKIKEKEQSNKFAQRPMENTKFRAMVKKYSGAENVVLGTNFTESLDPQDNLYFRLSIKSEFDERDDYYIYEVGVHFKKSKTESVNIGDGRIRVPKKKEEKK